VPAWQSNSFSQRRKKTRMSSPVLLESLMQRVPAQAHSYDQVAQFIAVCRRSKWSKHLPNAPCLALLAMTASKAAYKINSACSQAFCGRKFRKHCKHPRYPGRFVLLIPRNTRRYSLSTENRHSARCSWTSPHADSFLVCLPNYSWLDICFTLTHRFHHHR
jgi:hypothetical protein